MSCLSTDQHNALGYREVRLENDLLSLTILPDRGAEVSSLVHRKSCTDVLWKAPWGMHRQTTGDTETLWMDGYAGGWQEIFPNGGDPCVYQGALLGFHGEASVSKWDCIVDRTSSEAASAEFSVRLARSPFFLQRRITVEDGRPAVHIDEQLTNEGDEELNFMWGHHPAYGAPFLGSDCRLIVPAESYIVHGESMHQPWPGRLEVPGPDQRVVAMGYLVGLREAWYELQNQPLGFGIRWDWDIGIFPYVWLWQELRGSFGYPWYGRCYVMGVEPFTSIPGSGLANAIAQGTAKTLAAGASIKTTVRVTFTDCAASQ